MIQKKRFVCAFYGALVFVSVFLCACGRNRDGDRPLSAEPLDGPPIMTMPADPASKPIPLFSYNLGSIVPASAVSGLAADPTGEKLIDDYDGDGIPNSMEITTNQFVADYPRIVTRISAPITLEIRKSMSSISENHSETVEDSGVTKTISNSMEDRQYDSVNQKTMPYTSKESRSQSEKNAGSWGFSDESSVNGSGSLNVGPFCGSGGGGYSSKYSFNSSWENDFASSTASEKLAFVESNLVDNLDKNGTAFTDESVEKMTRNARQSQTLKNTEKIGPEDGYVRASLFIKNESCSTPARISNVKCTLTFRTPSGTFLPVKTFMLRNEDWSVFEQDVYGDEELGPYSIELSGLNTKEVSQALLNGYIPQIHVVSYDLRKVKDASYITTADNLKVIEENAKSRSSFVTVSAAGVRETYRVCAFDVGSNGSFSPGISLKKALFNIFRSRVGKGESWETDSEGKTLTVSDNGLKWKADAVNAKDYSYNQSNLSGNSWRDFETYIKTYTDGNNVTRRIETIKRIGDVSKYNPFDKKDNSSYDPNDLLSEKEIKKMKYWYIMHNGRYFEGDINDPIWVGERYEIVCVDVDDLNRHFKSFSYTPMQSMRAINMQTRWNTLTDENEFERGVYFGRLYRGDTVMLEVDLLESRFLFNQKNLNSPGLSLINSKNFSLTREPAGTGGSAANGSLSLFHHYAYGGCNNIRIEIIPPDNAEKYKIILKNPSGAISEYSVTAENLARAGNVFCINRETECLNGSKTGLLPPGIYSARVIAYGRLYGVEIARESDDSPQSASVTDWAGNKPGEFRYDVSGYAESLCINISESSNASYYAVKCTGPLNDPSGSAASTTFTASAGRNLLSVPSAPESFREKINAGEPGVFRIEVFPVNEGCVSTYEADSRFSGRPQFVTILFEKYAVQKKYVGKKSPVLSMAESVNLEVNFNDGSGWYKLKLMGGDTSERYIDCTYSNYMDYKNQKFYVSFTPPDGDSLSLLDFFRGGREYVDLYIRTQPRDEFRDRFWPNPDRNFDIQFTKMCNPYSEWLYAGKGGLTDATQFEWVLDNTSSVSGVFALGSLNRSDYLFSPYEYREYKVLASITGAMKERAEQNSARAPVFNCTTDSGNSITVSGIQSPDCSLFSVYYTQAGTAGMSAEEIENYKKRISLQNMQLWTKAADNVVPGQSVVIGNLTANVPYAVAAVGRNSQGVYSGAGFYKTGTDVLSFVTPINMNTPPAPVYSVSLCADGRSIFVSGIFAKNATSYKVYCIDDAGVPVAEREISASGEPVSVMFQADSCNLKSWAKYKIYAVAYNKYASAPAGVPGVLLIIETMPPVVGSNFSMTAINWTNIFNLKTDIYFVFGSVPENVVLCSGYIDITLNWEKSTQSGESFPFTVDCVPGNINYIPINMIYGRYGWYEDGSYGNIERMYDPVYRIVITSCTNKYKETVPVKVTLSEGTLPTITN